MMDKIRYCIEKRPFIIHLVVYIVIIFALFIGIYQDIRLNKETRELSCSIAKLISYVPAIQFEGESDQNFIGWVVARQDILGIARGDGCSEATSDALRARVRLDAQLLKELGYEGSDLPLPNTP